MPELNFVLPHWLYWSGLVLFPLFAFLIYRHQRGREAAQPVSLGLAYFFLLTGGFLGVHRLYLRSRWAFLFIALFVGVLAVNVEVRTARDVYSATSNAVHLDGMKIERAERAIEKARARLERRDSERNQARLQRARDRLADARAGIEASRVEAARAEEGYTGTKTTARLLGLSMFAAMLVDALLLPLLVRRRNREEAPTEPPGFLCPIVEQESDAEREPLAYNRAISRLNGFAGEFVAYWSIIAVFVYYYEVIARYVFNSPTNWAHEGMFLMFGMQYLLAGGFCLRENAHVRVDVIYMHLSKRAQAITDIITSLFFFVFVITLLVTGWIFFHDAYEVGEVSFTEWGIQYWPIKFALPLGAVLLLLQGIAQLLKDVLVAFHPRAAELPSAARPQS